MVSNGVHSKGRRLLGVFLVLNLLVPFANRGLAHAFALSGEVSGMIATFHQVAFALVGAICLGRIRSSEAQRSTVRFTWLFTLQIALSFLVAAELFYGLFAYIIQLPPPRGHWPLFYELPYAVFSILMAVAGYRRAVQGLRHHELNITQLAIACVSVAFFVCTYQLLLIPFFDITPARSPFVGGCVIAYSIGQSAFVGSLLVASLRAAGFREFFFWFSLLLMISADFAIRTQEIGAPVSSLSFFDYGWHFSIVAAGGILYLILHTRTQPNELLAPPTPLTSLRVLSSGVALGSLIAFIAVTSVVDPEPNPDHVEAVSSKMMILTVIWAFANIVSLLFSQLVRTSNDLLSKEIYKIKNLEELQQLAMSPVEFQGILAALKTMDEKLKHSMQENVRLQSMAEIGKVTAQVAHDIRSPLAALDVLSQEISNLPDDLRVLVRHAVGRIRDIANDLVSRNTPINDTVSESLQNPQESKSQRPVQISTLIASILSEKRIHLGEQSHIELQADFGPDAYGSFVQVNAHGFSRMLSNLLNNAIESIPDKGQVTVQLERQDEEFVIRITDTGKGISPEQLSRVGQAGVTFGKTGGTGLGLAHAIETCQRAGGTLNIQTELGRGTEVIIRLPRASAPGWFVPALELQRNMTILVLDDDLSVHALWKKRLERHTGPDQIESLQCFRSTTEFKNWFLESEPNRDQILALVDFEITNSPIDGLDLISELDIAQRSILVTSHCAEANVESQVSRMGMGMIPKDMAALVPIRDDIPTPPLRLRRSNRLSDGRTAESPLCNAAGSQLG